jgi:nucleoside-diphosphate-sugar epimerase
VLVDAAACGRPDLELFKFVHNILQDQPIDIYNHRIMKRNWIYVGDVARAIIVLIEKAPPKVVDHAASPASRATACPLKHRCGR